MKKVIFDFDGTLANSLPVVVSIAGDLLKYEASQNQIESFRNMTIKQVLKEIGVPLYKVPGILVKGRPLLQKRMHEVMIFPGLENVIKELASNGHKMYVVSSNSVGIINKFLTNYHPKQYFGGVYGNVGLFSKAQALKKVMKREGFVVEDSIYIGDEVRDIEAARKINMPIISVAWGYNGRQILSSYNPDYFAEEVTDIIKFINE